MANYTVKAGDCFSSIAKANGFYKYSSLYMHASNTATRLVRSNPNMLVVGDVVSIPDKRQKTVALVLDGTKNLVIHRELTRLLVYVGLIDKTVRAPANSQFSAGGKNSATLPDLSGKLELLDIDAAGSSGKLELQIAALPAAPLPVPVVVAAVTPLPPPTHPPAIVATQFTDAAPEFDTEAVRVRWTLKLGTLEPHTTIRGVLQRFVNLGYEMPVAEAETDKTKLLIRHWQASTGNAAPSGAVADVRAAIEALHDHP
jgi:hypothetical protein